MFRWSIISLFLIAALWGCKKESMDTTKSDKESGRIEIPANVVTTETGLKYLDKKVGTGPAPAKGQKIVVHYTGWFLSGIKFDSSVDRGEPLEFNVGVHQVIDGWDEGLLTMKVGGSRRLYIPSDLAYGDNGIPGAIPPKATLVFDVELLGVK